MENMNQCKSKHQALRELKREHGTVQVLGLRL
jgi:hypothetical protein